MDHRAWLEDGRELSEIVLNAFRHQRMDHLCPRFSCGDGCVCSTPFGINEWITVVFLNGTAAHPVCSTPFGINEWITADSVTAFGTVGYVRHFHVSPPILQFAASKDHSSSSTLQFFSDKHHIQASSFPRTRRKLLPLQRLWSLEPESPSTTHRCLIMRSETWMPDQPNPIDHLLNAEAPSQHRRHTSASQANRLLGPSLDSAPSAVFPAPPDPVGNGRYCIESVSHSPPEFLPLCEGALGRGRRTQ